MPVRPTDYAKYSTCRRCGCDQVELKTHKAGWSPRAGQRYYFTDWFKCPECGTIYLLESCKQQVGEWSGPPGQSDLFPLR